MALRRGELYRVRHPGGGDSKRSRVFCIVSREALIETQHPVVICAPIFSAYDGLLTQVPLGVADGMKHDCSIHCDSLMSLQKKALTDFVAMLSDDKIGLLNRALAAALDLPIPLQDAS